MSSWIWMAGCAAWVFDGTVQARAHNFQHSILAFIIAIIFAGAWVFYRTQRYR